MKTQHDKDDRDAIIEAIVALRLAALKIKQLLEN